MNSYDTVSVVTAIACLLRKELSDEQVALLALIFTQLGDTLATLAAGDRCGCFIQNSKNTQ